MIKMTHNDDHKERDFSHTISIRDDYPSRNPFDVGGYGATKEEAIEDFKNKFEYVMKELKAFETMLFDTDVITDSIIEVDCMGKEIKD